MKTKGLLLAILVILPAAAVALLFEEAHAAARRRQRHEEFQQLVRGLGFGPAIDLSRCPICFDPRLGWTCRQEQGPIPGGGYFCPQHALSVFPFPAFESQGDGKGDRDVETR
jgi:hypothetical protein